MKYFLGFSGLIGFAFSLGYFLNNHYDDQTPFYFGLLLAGSLFVVPLMVEIYIKARKLKTEKVGFSQISNPSLYCFIFGVFLFFLSLGYLMMG